MRDLEERPQHAIWSTQQIKPGEIFLVEARGPSSFMQTIRIKEGGPTITDEVRRSSYGDFSEDWSGIIDFEIRSKREWVEAASPKILLRWVNINRRGCRDNDFNDAFLFYDDRHAEAYLNRCWSEGIGTYVTTEKPPTRGNQLWYNPRVGLMFT